MGKVSEWISRQLNRLLFVVLFVRRRAKKHQDSSDIYLVRFAHMGDFFVWLDSAKAYRKLYPGRKIIFVTYRYKNVTSIAKTCGLFDETVAWETGGFKRVVSLIQAMKRHGDLVINANPSRSLLSDLIVMAIGANVRIAPESDRTQMSAGWLRLSDRIYDRIIPCPGPDVMELIRNAEFIRGLGLGSFKAGVPHLRKSGAFKELPATPYFIVFPDGEGSMKFWDYRKFTEIIRRLFQCSDMECVLMGSRRHRELGDQIMAGIAAKNRCRNLMGSTELTGCVDMIRHASLVICNDTGAAHMAAAVRTPAVVIAVGWDRGRFFPYRTEKTEPEDVLPIDVAAALPCLGCIQTAPDLCRLKCLTDGAAACVASVTVEQVWEAVMKASRKYKIQEIQTVQEEKKWEDGEHCPGQF